MERETIRNILVGIGEYFPSITSIWGLLLYTLITYCISVCCMRCMGAYTEDSFNIERAFKEQVLLERKKREEREKLAQQVRRQIEQRDDEDR